MHSSISFRRDRFPARKHPPGFFNFPSGTNFPKSSPPWGMYVPCIRVLFFGIADHRKHHEWRTHHPQEGGSRICYVLYATEVWLIGLLFREIANLCGPPSCCTTPRVQFFGTTVWKISRIPPGTSICPRGGWFRKKNLPADGKIPVVTVC